MDKNLIKRFIALVVTGGVLLSSTGVYTALAASEESTTSEYTTSALAGSEEVVTEAETTVPSTTDSTISVNSEAEVTTENTTEAETEAPTVQKPETTVKPETTAKPETTVPPVAGETHLAGDEYIEKPTDNKAFQWLGVDGTIANMGSETNPYAVSSVEHFLAMNAIINETGNSSKYFRLTANIDFDGVAIDDTLLQAQGESGMPGSLVSVNPSLTTSNVFFHLDGNGKNISNLEMVSDQYAALSVFGFVNSNSTITDLVISGTKVTNTYADAMAAGLILRNEGSVKDCNFTVVEISTAQSVTKAESFYPTDDQSLRVYSGTACIVDNSGIVDSENDYQNSNLVLAENVKITTTRPYAGTVVAQNRGKINKVRARYITVTGHSSSSDYVGGFVGTNATQRTSSSTGMYYCEILQNSSSGGVTGADKIGYFAGYNTGRIHRATVTGNIKSNAKATASKYDLLVYGGKAAGGIVGDNTGDVQLCTARDIGVYFADSTNGTIYGGIVGRTTYGVRNCIATGSTAGAGTAHEITRYIGGIVGYGDTGSNFSVENCYALVKIIESKAVLGAIVGFNGDVAYRNNKVRNVFYSSIISSRPSPVSYGGAGPDEGDLVFSRPYAATYYNTVIKPTVSVSASYFTFSGWGSASFNVIGNFKVASNYSYYTTTGTGTNSFTYMLSSKGQNDKTVVNYDVNITIPSGIGAASGATTLYSEPMEFGIFNSSAAVSGSGTEDDKFTLSVQNLNLLYYAPGAHFVATENSNMTMQFYTAPSATFWGTVDFNNSTIEYISNDNVLTPLFKGIYGSRDDSLNHNNADNHKSTPSNDAPANLEYGVVENLTLKIGVTDMSAVFGNICNATLKNINLTFSVDRINVTATDENTGLFAKTVYGNSYLYGCYIDSPQSNVYKSSSNNGVSGFIGTVDAEKAIIDNCGANLVVQSNFSNASNCAVFIGNIKSLDGGYIQNCYAVGGLVAIGGSFNSANSFIFAGNVETTSTQIQNCYFSPSYYYANNAGISLGIKAGAFTGSCRAWSFVQQSSSDNTKWNDVTMQVSTAETNYAYVASITNIDRFDITSYADGATLLSDYFSTSTSNNETVSFGSIMWYGRVGFTYRFNGADNANANITMTHKPTGLQARLTVFNSSDLDMQDGFYLIKSPIDLYWLSVNQTAQSEGKFLYMRNPNVKFKIVADIDMTGYSIEPIGTPTHYFQGEFVSAVDTTDGDYYTISNLTFAGEYTDSSLFGSVQGATLTGIHLDNASITGAAYTGALVSNVYDNVTMTDCKVTNSSVSGENHVGGLIGGIRNGDDDEGLLSSVITNCTVENTTVKSTKAQGSMAYIGGIVGGIGAGNSADKQHAVISGCKVNDCEISAASRGIGGIVGYARNNRNTITSCEVTGTTLTCTGTNGPTYASLGGVAGLFGGSSIAECTVTNCKITGECAAGIVTRLINEQGTTSTVSECTVTNSTITSDTNAGGILAQVSNFASDFCYGDKVINNCKVSADTTVKAAVAGGIVGNIQQFSDKKLTVSNCTNLGIVETTGNKGSQTDGAGGIIGRISSGMNTSGILVTGCLSAGTLKGKSNLGGVIGITSANVHTGENDLIKDCYVTAAFSSTNLAVSKGLIIGFVGYTTQNGIETLADKVVYSSLNTRAPLYGNIETTLAAGGGFDMNMGADQEKGITIDFTTSHTNATAQRRFFPYYANSIVGYEDGMMGATNVIELKTNFHIGNNTYEGFGTRLSCVYNGSTFTLPQDSGSLAATNVPRFSVGNLPALTGTDGKAFAVPTTNVFSTTASASKIKVGSTSTYNKLTDVNIQTYDKKCQAVVKTAYTGVVNGETITFDVGFTVIVRGEHAYDGTGTREDPFLIYEAEDLLSIKQHFEKPTDKDDYKDNPGYYYEAYYEVMNDIDMIGELADQSPSMSFAPIGSSDTPFRGHIFSTPGNQYTISNMLIDNPTSPSNYALSTYYAEDNYSDALGVFGYTDGAEIIDLKFENVTISSAPSPSNGYLGIRTGAVVGVARNTTIENVAVTGTVNIEVDGNYGGRAGAVGGIVGSVEGSVVLTDVSVTGVDNENRATITGLYQVGGIVGSAADSTGNSITNAVVENVNITNLATSGVSMAGGIAGQYSGVITGTYEEIKVDGTDEPEINEIRTRVNNVSVTGTVVGGVVGSGNVTNLASGDCHLTISMVDVAKTNVEVTDTVRNDSNKNINGIAGGILGTTHESYHYLIEDCTADADTTVTSGSCAGGILGKAKNRGVGTLQSDTSLVIRNCETQAAVEQLNAPTSKTISLGDEEKRKTGVASVIGVVTTEAFVMNMDTLAPQLQIKNVTAGGAVSGTFNVGGFVGEFATVQGNLNEMSDSIIYDCILTAKLTPLSNATERFGVILGSIEGNQENPNNPNQIDLSTQYPFPEQNASGTVEYAVKPFDKIFYSSYTAGDYNLYGISAVKNYSCSSDENVIYAGDALGVNEITYRYDENGNIMKDEDGNSVIIKTSSIYDVNHVNYNFVSPTDPNVVTKLPISVVTDGFVANDPTASYQWFGDETYVFSDDFVELLGANEGTGNPFGFTISGKEFTLAEDGVHSADSNVFNVIPNPDSNKDKYPYKIKVASFATADLVFTYTNGLQIGIPVICGVNFKGEGTAEDPILVENADIFYHIVKVLPNYAFRQTADINLSDESKYPATLTAQLISNFTGTYDGGGFKIEGFNVNVAESETPVGIFGKVSGAHYEYEKDENGNIVKDSEGNPVIAKDENGNSLVIPNVKNLTFENCTVSSGNISHGTGVFAGAITDGATVSGIKVVNSAATSSTGPVGGAVGTVSGATKLENVEVTGSTVKTAVGSAGGLIGTVTEDAVTIVAPKVSGTTVSSGAFASDGTFSGGAKAEDIAGGIVAQALGTITGAESTIDEDGNTVYPNAVENVTVQAYISGGAVGAVYKGNTASQCKLTLDNVRISDADIVAKSTSNSATAVSGAGILGYARNNSEIKFNRCYVDEKTKLSSISASGYTAYGAGAVARINQEVLKLDIIDTECYASVTVSESNNDGDVYAGGLIGFISSIENQSFNLNNITMDGSVAGGKIVGKAMHTYVGGVIGGFDTGYITSEITTPFFTNGVISATVESQDGNTSSEEKPVHRYGKFIAGYENDLTPVFVEENFSKMFAGNYYSTYPQDYAFFATETGAKGEYDAIMITDNVLTEEEDPLFTNINVQGNLTISDETRSSWNSVAITSKIGTPTTLYARLAEEYAELPYGSSENERVAEAAGGFALVETATDEEGNPISCIDLDGDVSLTENVGEFMLVVIPTDYGAEQLIAEYTCGLQTTTQIISVEIKGIGTADNPYLISTPTQLRVVAYLARGNYHFRQINDIDLSNSYNSNGTLTDKFIHYNSGNFTTPIGTDSAPFDGVYDGQGYKIEGLKINRKDSSDIGLFGVVAQNGTLVPEIKNVHVQLAMPDTSKNAANGIVANENVGGIVGRISNGIVKNCSVTMGNVTGKNNVGGIVGNFSNAQIINCFTQSDVNAFGNKGCYAGGIAGYVNNAGNGSTISGCFSSGSIYATPTSSTAGSGDKSNAAGIVSYIANSADLSINKCLFTGTTASGYGILANASAGNMTFKITDCIDAGQNIAMAAGDGFDKITNAVAPTLAGTITLSNIYYDSALLKVGTAIEDYTGLPTSELTKTETSLGTITSDDWTIENGFYPVPKTSEISVIAYQTDENGEIVENEITDEVTGEVVLRIPVIDEEKSRIDVDDAYSQAYAKFLSAPIQTSEKEECDDISEVSVYGKGLVYPVTLLTNIGGSDVTYSSSIFDPTDVGDYPEDFDINLYGVRGIETITVENEDGTTSEEERETNNKNVDLLFENKSTGYTSVYRNIFDTTVQIANKADFEEKPTKNTYVNSSAATGGVFSNGEVYYNAQVPVVSATATIDGVEVYRDIKIPLSYGATYCIATQRQLYALGGNEADKGTGHKFNGYYGSAFDYKLITDIDCTELKDEEGNPISFVPIGYNSNPAADGYTGKFDGSGHKITGLTIKGVGDYTGFFSKLSFGSGRTSVENLTLENSTVEGNNYVGTLVGYVESSEVKVTNCHATGEIDYKFTYVEAENGDYVLNEEGEYVLAGENVTGTHNREYERDVNDNYVLDVENAKGIVTGTGAYVGGLIGKVAVDAATIEECSSTVLVRGNDSVGGLIGESNGTIIECYATGNVICDKLVITMNDDNNIRGAGGLIGVMSGGSVTKSFASGNVEVKEFAASIARGEFGIGGFVGYVNEVTEEIKISECFSGGNVSVGTTNTKSTVYSAPGQTVIVGIGGFSGINYASINNVYSSAAITADLENITSNGGDYKVGVGGVSGVALENVTNIYSSGSVTRPVARSEGFVEPEGSYYGVGGTIGTVGGSGAVCESCYYDGWTNNIHDLTSIGDEQDNNKVMSLTTTELTNGKRPSTYWSGAWGYTAEAYPYLKSLLNEEVDNHIKTNAILSVVRVSVEEDDVSAKSGRGLTMSLTVSDAFVYTDTEKNQTYRYELVWSGATYDSLTKQAAMIRKQNIQETIDLIVYVSKCYINGEVEKDDDGNEVDYTEYANRIYSRLCAEMRGTLLQPYLISNETDLAHVNMTADELAIAQANHTGFYDQWATPIDSDGNPLQGTVHYQLSMNIELTDSSCDACGEEIHARKIGYDPSVAENYEGFALIGNGYQIRTAEGVKIDGCYIENVDENSTIANVLFDLEFAGSTTANPAAVIKANNGNVQDVYAQSTIGDGTNPVINAAGLVLTNNGTIDGSVVDATIKGAQTDVGVMAKVNNGTISNSGTAGTLATAQTGTISNIGAFVVNNTGRIEDSFSMADMDVLTTAGATVENLSGFAATNSGTMNGVYTRSAISFANTPAPTTTIASLVGKVTSVPEGVTEPVTNAYSAGLLGYYNDAQDSILFGDAGTMPKLSSVYVDKSLAGASSKNSYKYSASLSNIISLEYMPDSMKYVPDDINTPEVNEENSGKFTAGEEGSLTLPQLASILNKESNSFVDENGNLLYVDESGKLYVETAVFAYKNVVTNEERVFIEELEPFVNAETNENEYDGNGNLIYVDADGNKYVKSDAEYTYYYTEANTTGAPIGTNDAYQLYYDVFMSDTEITDDAKIIRNYDIIKAYSKISSMTIKTAQSQYADRLVVNSTGYKIGNETLALYSQLSDASKDNIQFNPASQNNIIGIINANRWLYTNADALGKESVKVNYKNDIELSRGIKINPQLLIDVEVVGLGDSLNPNFSDGSGTIDDPYVISDASSLTSLHYYGTESDLYFILGADIDMSDVDDFQIHHFTAKLNDPYSEGGSTAQYTIQNFNPTTGHGGLFGTIEKGAVVNNVALTGTIVGSEEYTGALANIINDATVTNCVIAADVTSGENALGTGVFAGRVTGLADGENVVETTVSGIVTTGNVAATSGAAGGVIGYAENATMSEFLSTANVGEGDKSAGIIGDIGTDATLTNVLYGGVAESLKPITASYVDEAAITEAYYDTQMNKNVVDTEESPEIGDGLKTKACESLIFDDSFTFIDNGFYPVPTAISQSIAFGIGTGGIYESYGSTAALAATTMNFYLGSSVGEIGFYTSMQFAEVASATPIVVTEDGKENPYYFSISDPTNGVYVVKTAKYNVDEDPSIVLTLPNGAKRTVNPGLVRNANISYIITNPGNFETDGKLLGVLFKSVSDKESFESVQVLNDFTKEIGENQTVDALALAEGMNGFYVGDMLPDGYRLEITAATLGGTAISTEDEDETDDKVYGTFVTLPDVTDDEGNIATDVVLTLTIVEEDKPWGVNSIVNTL